MTAFPNRLALVLLCGLALPCAAQDMPLTQVLIPDEEWELVSQGHTFTEAPAVAPDGTVFFADVPTSEIFRIDLDGSVHRISQDSGRTSGLMFHPDGRLIGCQNGRQRIVAYTLSKDRDSLTTEVLVDGVTCNDLVVRSTGHIYWTDPQNETIWLRAPDGEVTPVVKGFKPNGIILTPDEGTLVAADIIEPVLRAYRVLEDGTLDAGSPYYAPVQMPSGEERPGSDGMTCDTDGRLYVATHAGLQMWDPTGRLGGAIAKPQRAFLANCVFGGKDFRTLFVTCKDKVYRRRVKPKGAAPNLTSD